MTKKEITCIGCPMGCEIEVMLADDGKIASVTGNTCRRGDVYARKEIEAPRRIVTSTIKVTGSLEGASCVSCKTETDIPKEKIFDVISELFDLLYGGVYGSPGDAELAADGLSGNITVAP